MEFHSILFETRLKVGQKALKIEDSQNHWNRLESETKRTNSMIIRTMSFYIKNFNIGKNLIKHQVSFFAFALKIRWQSINENRHNSILKHGMRGRIIAFIKTQSRK